MFQNRVQILAEVVSKAQDETFSRLADAGALGPREQAIYCCLEHFHRLAHEEEGVFDLRQKLASSAIVASISEYFCKSDFERDILILAMLIHNSGRYIPDLPHPYLRKGDASIKARLIHMFEDAGAAFRLLRIEDIGCNGEQPEYEKGQIETVIKILALHEWPSWYETADIYREVSELNDGYAGNKRDVKGLYLKLLDKLKNYFCNRDSDLSNIVSDADRLYDLMLPKCQKPPVKDWWNEFIITLLHGGF